MSGTSSMRLEQLGPGEGMPVEAIRAATADRETVAPILREAIERCEPKARSRRTGSSFVPFAWPMAGEVGLSRAGPFPAPAGHRVDHWRCHDGDQPQGHGRVFDGDPGSIYDIINDVEADEFVRSRMFDALVLLALQGELDRTNVAEFLRSGFSDLQPQDRCAVWEGRQGAVAMLGLAEFDPWYGGHSSATSLKTRVESRILKATSSRPAPAGRCNGGARNLSYLEFVEELADWAGFQPKKTRRSCGRVAPRAMAGDASAKSVPRCRPQRSLPLWERQEIQEMLPRQAGRGASSQPRPRRSRIRKIRRRRRGDPGLRSVRRTRPD